MSEDLAQKPHGDPKPGRLRLTAVCRRSSPGASTGSSNELGPSSGDTLAEPGGRSGRPIRREALLAAAIGAAAIGGLYVLLPQLAGLSDTWQRINRGDPAWLAVAVLFEILSFGAYIALFRAVFAAHHQRRIDLRASYEITMAGLAATRLFALAGIGGIAITTWALRRAAMTRREVVRRMTAYLVLVYGVFMVALIVGGVGLRLGLFTGAAPFALTVVPATFAACVIALALGLAGLPSDTEHRIRRFERRLRVPPRVRNALAVAPGLVAEGVRGALALMRRRPLSLVGAVAWWGFDIAVLWAAFEAFGGTPSVAVIVVSYFVGMLANTLPLPGGIGGVEGGMIGALIGFGVAPGLAIVAVLSYRAIAFWLPTIPGVIAFMSLRRTVHRWELQDDLEALPGHRASG
ncbi:MAG TPA: lysylphosphatidylglycerol synthase transmembrane domain-containing protein [Solirubrobacterales bacterium]